MNLATYGQSNAYSFVAVAYYRVKLEPLLARLGPFSVGLFADVALQYRPYFVAMQLGDADVAALFCQQGHHVARLIAILCCYGTCCLDLQQQIEQRVDFGAAIDLLDCLQELLA